MELQALLARYNHDDEEDFVAELQTSPGDFTLLRVEAKRLIQRDEMRGNHLTAEIRRPRYREAVEHSPLMVAL